jgi:dihydrofolate reductase
VRLGVSGTRKIILNFYMTLDGFGEWPEYPGSSFAPTEPDLMFQEQWISLYDSVDTVVFGRRAYEGHQTGHALAARKPDDPPYLYDFSRFLERSKIVVLSSTLKEAKWGNARIMSGPLEEVVAKLKSEPGEDIIVDGGPGLVKEFIEKDLGDDYRIVMWPVIYGRGPAYWPTMTSGQRTLRLISAKTLSYGEVLLHYEAVR